MNKIDPEVISSRCREELIPETFELPRLSNANRYDYKIENFIEQYDSGRILNSSSKWPVRYHIKSRKTKNDNPRHLESEVLYLLREMKKYLKQISSDKKKLSIAVLCSTNRGVGNLCRTFKKGSLSYKCKPIKYSTSINGDIFLLYTRFILELLKSHWCMRGQSLDTDDKVAAIYLNSLCNPKRDDKNKLTDTEYWSDYIRFLIKKITKMQQRDYFKSKMSKDIAEVNKIIRLKKEKLPKGTPKTPFDQNDIALLDLFQYELLEMINSIWNEERLLDYNSMLVRIDRALQKKVLYDKIGIVKGVEIMTIHKSKGREFDGVILVFEDEHDAI